MSRTKYFISAIAFGGLFTIGLLTLLLAPGQTAEAAVYGEESSTTYKEYWIDHVEFASDCETTTDNGWYAEPSGGNPCLMNFTIEDDFSSAIKAEIYVDLWRNRDNQQAHFSINDGLTRYTNVGSDWSRTPYIREIPLSEFVQGTNTITFFANGQNKYHIHDVAFRIYYDDANPLAGVDVAAPDAAITAVIANNQTFAPQAGGILDVDDDQVTLVATATTDAKFLEFHAYYEGYDLDNDGQTADWHGHTRNNWHPGGTNPQPTGGTVGHVGTVEVGTDPDATYSVTWDIPHIVSQEGVRFKIRVVDDAGNVRDAAGGVSADFTLERSYAVLSFRIEDFEDDVLNHGGTHPITTTKMINIPVDPSQFDTAYILGMFYNRLFISINDNTDIRAFLRDDDDWQLSNRDFDVSYLQEGENTLQYSMINTNTFAIFIERPGPMIVLRQDGAVQNDTDPPTVLSQSPEADESGVAANTAVSIRLADLGTGVDESSIIMRVNGDVVVPTITGNPFDYEISYTPAINFLAGQLVTVQLDAADEANNSMTTLQYSFTVEPPSTNAGFVSDDFNSCALNGAWTAVNPLSSAEIRLNDDLNSLLLGLPEGIVQDFSSTLQNAPHLLQDVNDGNFDIEAKVGSLLGDEQLLGLISIADSDNFVRVALENDAGTTALSISTIDGGVATVEGSANIANSNPIYLNLIRSGALWTLRYSYDQSGWTQVAQFNHVLSLAQVGAFAGNMGSAPAHTAVFDDIIDAADPLSNIDMATLLLPIDTVGEGTVTRSVACGLPLTLQATPELGWAFVEWQGSPLDGSTDDNPTINSLTTGDAVTAVFEEQAYTIDVDLINQHSPFDSTPTEDGGTITVEPEQATYSYGDMVTLTAMPEQGWQFDSWQGSQTGLAQTVVFSITESSVISATFAQETYTVSAEVEAGDEGDVTIAPEQGGYVYGDMVTITAVETDAAWQFISWTGDNNSSDNPLQLTLTESVAIEANFSQNQPPQITTPLDPTYNIVQGELLELAIQTVDADGDDITITVENAPPNLVLTDNGDGTAMLLWTPQVGDDGSYDVTIRVSDGEDSVTQMITIVVEGLQQLFLPMVVKNP